MANTEHLENPPPEITKLVVDLRKAGFPQRGSGRLSSKPGHSSHWGVTGFQDFSCDCWLYFPTLSELVKACGVEFGSLALGEDERWHAFSNRKDSGGNFLMACGHAQPESAVAHLWLALRENV